jgi:hypothetical protein
MAENNEYRVGQGRKIICTRGMGLFVVGSSEGVILYLGLSSAKIMNHSKFVHVESIGINISDGVLLRWIVSWWDNYPRYTS